MIRERGIAVAIGSYILIEVSGYRGLDTVILVYFPSHFTLIKRLWFKILRPAKSLTQKFVHLVNVFYSILSFISSCAIFLVLKLIHLSLLQAWAKLHKSYPNYL